jgi:hypothetical protein
MRVLLAVLGLTFIFASVAAIFAIWPVVADAPWEDGSSAEAEDSDSTNEVRCEAALSLKEAIIRQGEYSFNNQDGLRDYDGEMFLAERDIRRYC